MKAKKQRQQIAIFLNFKLQDECCLVVKRKVTFGFMATYHFSPAPISSVLSEALGHFAFRNKGKFSVSWWRFAFSSRSGVGSATDFTKSMWSFRDSRIFSKEVDISKLLLRGLIWKIMEQLELQVSHSIPWRAGLLSAKKCFRAD